MVLAYKFVSIVVIAVMGATALGGGAALVSADSLPGQALYPLKLAFEDVHLGLISDPASRAEEGLALVAERVEEMEQLSQQGEPIPEQVADRLVQQMEQVMSQVTLAQPEDVPALMNQVNERLRWQWQVLEAIQAGGPDGDQPAVRHALQATERIRQALDAAQGDPGRFRYEYEHRYRQEGTPGPHGGPAGPITPAGTAVQQQEREQHREQAGTPEPTGPGATMTPAQNQHRYQYQEQAGTATPSGPGPTDTPPVGPGESPEVTPEPGGTAEPPSTPEPPGPSPSGEPPASPPASPSGEPPASPPAGPPGPQGGGGH